MTINLDDSISILLEKKNEKGKEFFVISGLRFENITLECKWTYISDFMEYLQCYCSNQLTINQEYLFDKFSFKVEKIDNAYCLIIADDYYNHLSLSKIEAKKIIAKSNRIIARTNILK